MSSSFAAVEALGSGVAGSVILFCQKLNHEWKGNGFLPA
jgi:hypothetical protein